MNKKIITVTGIIILLLVIGAAAFLMSAKNKPGTQPDEKKVTDTQEQNETNSGGLTSLKNLLMAGVSQTCTYSDTANSVNITGTTYISGGKVRSDFSSIAEGKTTIGHNIYDGKTSYVWMDESTTGIMMEIDASAEKSDSQTQEGLDINKTIDYKCQVWVPDQSLFTPPADVKFSSFSIPTISADSVMGTNDTGTPNTASLCDSCNALTGEQKTQCLTALKCD